MIYRRNCVASIIIIIIMYIYLVLSLYVSLYSSSGKEASYYVNRSAFIKNGEMSGTKELFEVKLIPGLMDLINPLTNKYLLDVSYHLENKDLCLSEDSVTVLLFILSASENVIRRSVIRETWGNSSLYSMYGKVKVMFLLGKNKDLNFQKNIDEEFKQHGDILQGQFMDSYQNLSHKTAMGFKWLMERCRNAKYILKTDDDLVINMFRVLRTGLYNMDVNNFHVQCMRFTKFRIIRGKPLDKINIEYNQLKGMIYQIPFCQGQYVLFLNAIVPQLYKAAMKTPFFWVDDQFSYGFVMDQIPSLKYKETRTKEYVSFSQFKNSHCWKNSSDCRYLVITIGNDNEIKDCWFYIKQLYTSFKFE